MISLPPIMNTRQSDTTINSVPAARNEQQSIIREPLPILVDAELTSGAELEKNIETFVNTNETPKFVRQKRGWWDKTPDKQSEMNRIKGILHSKDVVSSRPNSNEIAMPRSREKQLGPVNYQGKFDIQEQGNRLALVEYPERNSKDIPEARKSTVQIPPAAECDKQSRKTPRKRKEKPPWINEPLGDPKDVATVHDSNTPSEESKSTLTWIVAPPSESPATKTYTPRVRKHKNVGAGLQLGELNQIIVNLCLIIRTNLNENTM
jgi:hypothetical protein